MSAKSGTSTQAITLGEWFDLVNSRGWSDERVWGIVHDCARAALTAVRRRLRRGEDDDLVADLVLLARTAPAGWRRSERRSIGMTRWLAGVVKRRLLAIRRRELPSLGSALGSLEAPVPRSEPTSAIDPGEFLTPKQLSSWELHEQGVGTRVASRMLGITRYAQRDRVRRARLRLASRARAVGQRDPTWLAAAAKQLAATGDRRNVPLLLLRCAGISYRMCAQTLRTTVAAVASRLHRLWKMWERSLAEQRSDTDLPCAAFTYRGRSGRRSRRTGANGALAAAEESVEVKQSVPGAKRRDGRSRRLRDSGQRKRSED
jgi:hypothetical protein